MALKRHIARPQLKCEFITYLFLPIALHSTEIEWNLSIIFQTKLLDIFNTGLNFCLTVCQWFNGLRDSHDSLPVYFFLQLYYIIGYTHICSLHHSETRIHTKSISLKVSCLSVCFDVLKIKHSSKGY